jgi:hypothetical protein
VPYHEDSKALRGGDPFTGIALLDQPALQGVRPEVLADH